VRRNGAIAAAALVAAAVAAVPAAAYSRPGSPTVRVSLSSSGAQGTYKATGTLDPCATTGVNSEIPCSSAMSPDGRYVVFSSPMNGLVTGDNNNMADVFLRDRLTGKTEIESVSSAGVQATGLRGSFSPDLTPDASRIVFTSGATNLASGVPNPTLMVFLHERGTGKTTLVSVDSNGLPGAGGASINPVISANGRFVAFQSDATNLVAGDTNLKSDVFVHDLVTGKTVRVSVASDGTQGDGQSYGPSISADGRYVAFTSEATNLVTGDNDGNAQDVFVRDTKTGRTVVASVATGATTTASDDLNGSGKISAAHSLSADGRYVVFRTVQSNLVPHDSGAGGSTFDIFVHDMRTDTTERVSVASSGEEFYTGGIPLTFSDSNYPAISASGRFVAFYSNIEAPGGYTNGYVYLRDLYAQTTEVISLEDVESEDLPIGSCGNAASVQPDPALTISANGRLVAFSSCNGTLVKGDTNNFWDTFVHDRGTALGVGVVNGVASQGSTMLSGARLISRAASHDLLLQQNLKQAPADIPLAATIEYGFDLHLGGSTYRAIAQALPGADYDKAGHATFELFKLDSSTGRFRQVALLHGGYGTTGNSVELSIPFAAIGLSAGAHLSEVRAFAAIGSEATGVVQVLDQLQLIR
jgi:Tol biopolymer transport system component